MFDCTNDAKVYTFMECHPWNTIIAVESGYRGGGRGMKPICVAILSESVRVCTRVILGKATKLVWLTQ